LAHSPAWLLRGDAVITGDPSQTGTRDIHALEAVYVDLGNRSFLQAYFLDQHQRQLAQKNFRERSLRLPRSVEHPILPERVVKAFRFILPEEQAVKAGPVDAENRTADQLDWERSLV